MVQSLHSLLPAPERSRNIQENDFHARGKVQPFINWKIWKWDAKTRLCQYIGCMICFPSKGCWGTLYTSGIKIAVKAKWLGQVRLLPTGMKLCFLIFVYLYKYNHVSWYGSNSVEFWKKNVLREHKQRKNGNLVDNMNFHYSETALITYFLDGWMKPIKDYRGFPKLNSLYLLGY